MLKSIDSFFSKITPPLLLGSAFGACGYLGGFIYAKLNHLPPAKVAHYWAIYSAASGALQLVVSSMIKNENTKILALTTLSVVTGGCFISVMLHQELMSQVLLSVFLAIHLIGISILFFKDLVQRQPS